MKKFDEETCILIPTCDKYEDIWEPYFTLKNRYWKNNYKTFLLTETKKCKWCDTVNVNEKIWTKRLREGLKKLDYKYVIISLEDFFIREPVNQEKIELYIKNFPKHAAVINLVNVSNKIKSNILDLSLKEEDCGYKCNCQFGIWDREKLISLLANDGSAWDWELSEPCVSGYKYYSVSKNDVINYGYGKYWFGINAGKWVKKDVVKLFKKENITIDYSKRGFTHNYQFIHNVVHGIKVFFYPLYKIYCNIVGKEYGRKKRKLGLMDPETLNELHKVEIEILDEIVKVCKKYDIKYSILFGTLLGAVRHKGFIPWDDDLDIGMTPEDYLKFLEVAPKELGKDFYLDDVKYNKNYYLWFAKVKKKNTIFVEDASRHMKKIDKAIFVDVFPFVNVDEKDKNYIKKFKKFHFLQMMICAKNNMYNTFNGKILKVLSLPFSTHYLTNKQKDLVFENKNSNSKYLACFGVLKIKNIFERSELFPLKEITFENRKYSCVKNADLYLKTVYGDYMQLPPEDKRVAHYPVAIEILENNKK